MARKGAQLSFEERIDKSNVPVEERPFEIPQDWKWCRLGDVYDINPKNDAADEMPSSFVPMDKASAGMGYRFDYDIQPWKQAKKGHVQFADGDVAFAKITPCFENRKSMIIQNLENGIGAGSTEFVVLRQSAMNQFFTYYLIIDERFIRGGLGTYAGTVGQQRINMDFVKRYPIPVPPRTVQDKIAGLIDHEFQRLDEAKDKIQSVLVSSEERKQSILHKAFTGELTEKWRRAHNHSINEWKTITLDECGEWYGGGTPSKSHPEYWDNADFLWITSKDMKTDLIEDTQIKINQSGVDGSSAKLIENPAILFVMRSGILRHTAPIAMVKTRFTVNQDLKALVIRKDILLEYVFYACREKEHEILNTCMKNGTTVESLEFDKLKKLQIRVPSAEEQKEIVRLLNFFIEKEDKVEDASNQIMLNVEDNKKSILSKAFRGELHL